MAQQYEKFFQNRIQTSAANSNANNSAVQSQENEV